MNRLETKCLIASAGMHALLVAVLVFGAAFFKDKDADAPKRAFQMFDSHKIAEIASGGNPNGGATEIKDEPPAPAAPQPAVAPPPPPPPPPAPVQPPPQAQPEPPKAAPEVVKVPVVNPRPTVTRPPKQATKSEVPHIIETKGKTNDKKTSPTKSETKETAKKSDTKTDSKKPQVAVDLTRHVFNNTNKKQTDPNSKSREQAEKEAQDKADQAARDAWEKKQRIATLKRQTEISGSLRDLQKGLASSGGLSMEPLGPGGGSSTEVYADYASVVLRAYDQAWVVGNEITDEMSTVKVSVTIARNGDVMSARIIKRSGNTLLDRTVQTALESVKFIAPFPDTTREAERTFTFTFNLKAKRQLG